MANSNLNWLGNKVMQNPSDYSFGLNAVPTQNETTNPPAPPMTPSPNQNEQNQPPIFQQGPPPVTDIDYIPGYLASIIGKNVRCEFIIGTSQYVDKTGVMLDVGVNYFVLNDVNSRTNIMCDLYSVKFVTVIV